MFLLNEMHDPHTGFWFESLLGTKNLLSYHGSGAMLDFGDWDTVFTELMDKPMDVVIVEIKGQGQGRGLSPNNPYRMMDEAVELEIDIDPPSLANRLLAVRDKIGKEWSDDLDLVISVNDQILPSYVKRNKAARESPSKGADKDDDEGEYEYKRSFAPLQAGDMSSGDFNFGSRSIQTFDRGAIYLMNHHPSFGMDGSPLRASSFDLLFLLSLQESIHRVLTSYKQAGEKKDVSFAWLKEFYIKNLDTYFDGNQSFGRADDFMDDLLNKPPALKTIKEDGDIKMGFIDPMAIAEDIISHREEVAREWQTIVSNTSEEQDDIRKEVFKRQMEKWGQPIVKKEEKKEETKIELSQKKQEVKGEKKEKKVRAETNAKESSILEEITALDLDVEFFFAKRVKKKMKNAQPIVIEGGDFE